MPIIVIANTKGGTGKSTLATNLAVESFLEGKTTLLIDADKNLSSYGFYRTRVNNGLPHNLMRCESELTRRVGPLAEYSAKQAYDNVIVDCGGHDSDTLRAALWVADIMLIPVQPKTTDIWTLADITKIASRAKDSNKKLDVKIVINLNEPSPAKRLAARTFLLDQYANEGFDIMEDSLARRIVYDNAMLEGKGVSEYSPKDYKAIEEIKRLYNYLTRKVIENASQAV